MYYWKGAFSVTSAETAYLNSIKVRRIYLRFFDVDWNPVEKLAQPAGDLLIQTENPQFEIVPAVFITNNTLLNTPDSLINPLSEKILNKIFSKLSLFKNIAVNEIQLDCDWNQNTKEKYFGLVRFIRKKANEKNIILSATIRLHQIKYRNMTGVPPADKGMLMFYNMSSVSEYKTDNSIFNSEAAKKYLTDFKTYPLSLDVALPAFSWGVLFRGNKITALINDIKKNDLYLLNFKALDNDRFLSMNNFLLKGKYVQKNDVIRIEEISPSVTKSAAELIAPYIESKNPAVAIYNFNTELVKNYGKEDFKNIFSAFN